MRPDQLPTFPFTAVAGLQPFKLALLLATVNPVIGPRGTAKSTVAPVVEALGKRPASQNVVITGRTMARPPQDIADTISVVQDERHAFCGGIKAQAGIEY